MLILSPVLTWPVVAAEWKRNENRKQHRRTLPLPTYRAIMVCPLLQIARSNAADDVVVTL